MKPSQDPANDSLISGLNMNNQDQSQIPNPPQVPSYTNTTPQGVNEMPQTAQPENTAFPPAPSSPFENPSYIPQEQPAPVMEHPETLQTQQMNQPPQQFSENPMTPPADIQLPQNPPTPTSVPSANTPAQIFNPPNTAPPVSTVINAQTSSPNDPPPSPPTQPQMNQTQPDLTSAVVSEKPKKKVPVLLIILLLLVIGVLGTVGFLAYQNYQLSKNMQESPLTQASLKIPEAVEKTPVDPYLNYVSYQSTTMPLTFMHPKGWIVEETEDEELANQKMIKINSADFSYEGSDIASGFDLRIGPVNDLTKKYDTFDAFAVEENADGLFVQEAINGHLWLVKGNEAKTLINKSPLTIALYSGQKNTQDAVSIFRNILNSINISETVYTETPDTLPSTP